MYKSRSVYGSIFVFWWRFDFCFFSFGRYFYNRMGYWSDWLVFIFMIIVVVFIYIVGFLVCGVILEGRWFCFWGKGDLVSVELLEGFVLV